MEYKKFFKNKFFKKLFVYVFWFLPDKHYLKIAYYLKLGKSLNIKNPKTFNEKINWLKMNDSQVQKVGVNCLPVSA